MPPLKSDDAGLTAGQHRGWPDHWPLSFLVIGFPLWWIMGISSFVPVLAAVPMAWQLFHRRTVRLPHGYSWWLIFMVWVIGSGFTLWVDAPYAVPGGGLSRISVFVYRVAWYAACGIVLLWVCNLSEESLPTKKVVRLIGWMFLFTVVGGLLGVLVPNLHLTSLIELILPKGFTRNAFVRSLVHPTIASIQDVLGEAGARPTAPFAFANSWGSNLSMFLPFFLLSWFGKGAGWRRGIAPVVLIVATIPIIASLNRGLWSSLIVGCLFFVVRLAFSGRVFALIAATVVAVIAGMVFIASPLGTLTSERLNNPHSNERRGQLLSQTVASTVEGSPIVGFGSTRDVRGSFASIAGGGTPECPACRVPPLGTQGQIWMVIFSQGLLGTAIFVAFLASQGFRFWRCRTSLQKLGVCLLIFYGIQVFVYDMYELPLFTVMIGIGLMWRERYGPTLDSGGMTMASLWSRLRANSKIICALVVIGTVVGGGIATTWTPTYTATASVLLAQSPVYLNLSSSPDEKEPKNITIDTEAAMVLSERSIQQVLKATGLSKDENLRSRVVITAPANTKVLNIGVRDSNRDQAVALANALSVAYLDVRGHYLTQRRDQLILELTQNLNAVKGSGQLAEESQNDSADSKPSSLLEEDRLRDSIADLKMMPTEAGEILRSATYKENRRVVEVPMVSGALIGALLAFAVVAVRGDGQSGRRRFRRSEEGRRTVDVVAPSLHHRHVLDGGALRRRTPSIN